ncbi:hypothetical protein [Chitinophaga alhagiae]|uniref:DUF6438 domain-containing protein n=1 Tax=Chitinophaga alhagiae TaxID=2203219 RepID=UPI0013008D7C|nr:hypothetical protein [Chitinophaga alhagiae]
MRHLLLLCFLCSTLPAFSQTDMAKLSTDEEVLVYVKDIALRQRLYWNNIDFDQLAVFKERGYLPEDLAFGETVSRTKWLLHDFNGDGKKDLLFNGRLMRFQNAVVAFISTGDTLTHTLVSGAFSIFPHSIAIVEKDGRQLLEYGQIENNPGRSWRESYMKDTLAFQLGDFMEYRPMADHALKFDAVTYHSSSSWTGNRTPFIRIYADGRFQYTMLRIVKEKDQAVMVQDAFSAHLTTAQVEELQQVLRAAAFHTLADQYSLKNVYDLATAHTTVYFNNGGSKSITDYGMEGTYGLRMLYKRILALKAAVKWELVSTSKVKQ